MRSHRALGVIALGLWLGYALPLFFPPASLDCGAPVGADAGLLARLFPAVPEWWVALRLAALLGAALIAGAIGYRMVAERAPLAAPPPMPPTGVALWCALAWAAAQVIVSFWASELGRAAQLSYVAGLTVPALILWSAQAKTPRRSRDRWALIATLAVVGAWVLLRAPAAFHSPRTADAVDTLGAFSYLEATAPLSFNLLTDHPFKATSALFFVLQGAGILGSDGIPLTLPALLAINLAWMSAIAIGMGVLAARLIAPAVAPLAAAIFLFSPFALLAPLGPIALFHAGLLTIGLLLLVIAVHTRRSPAAVAAFGALAGLGASHPLTLPITLVAGAAALWSALRPPRLAPLPIAVAVLSFAAAVLPGRPSMDELRSMQASYSFGRRAWRPLEHILLGQASPLERTAFIDAGRSRPLDIPLGALLSPFAIPRTPVRLWGDALYDPIGTGLAAAGIVAALGAARASPLARALLILLAVGLAPAFVSSTDRPSLTRASIAHAVLPLLAGFGFEAARRGFGIAMQPRVLAALASVGVAASGIVLFDAVNPRILPASATGIMLEALGPTRSVEAVVLDHHEVEFGFLQISEAAARVPAQPIASVAYAGPADLSAAVRDGRVVLWSPGLEAQHQVARELCGRWPAARLYTLHDRSGCSTALAAAVGDSGWRPALPDSRWSTRTCE